MKIAIAAYKNAINQNAWYDDLLLKSALENNNVAVDIVDWQEKSINFLEYSAIVVNTTWNAHHYPSEFQRWLLFCESDGIKRLINDKEILFFGFKKNNYLELFLKKFGSVNWWRAQSSSFKTRSSEPLNNSNFPYRQKSSAFMPEIFNSLSGSVIPSLFIDASELHHNEKLLIEKIQQLKKDNADIFSRNIVIKPFVSADGENTHCFGVKHRPFKDIWTLFKNIIKQPDNGLIIQPYIDSVDIHGEYQLVFFANNFSHATLKPPGFKKKALYEKKVLDGGQLPVNMLVFSRAILNFIKTQFPDSSITRTRIDFF